MIVGNPKEIKDNEYRVALTPGGAEALVQGDPALAQGVNTYLGQITHPAVADVFGLEYTPLDQLL